MTSTTPTIESMDGVGGTVRSAIEGLRERAGVSSVYGEPVEVGGKTIIPVARIAYGFGGGFGSGPEAIGDAGEDAGETETETEPEGRGGSGGGGGGGVAATPVGVVEVTAEETRFVRFGSRRRLGLAIAAGLAIGFLLGRR